MQGFAWFVPMPPWMGPPLPMGLEIYWPFVVQSNPGQGSILQDLESSVRLPARRLTPESRYSNEETWEIEWNADALPTKIIVHREAKQR